MAKEALQSPPDMDLESFNADDEFNAGWDDKPATQVVDTTGEAEEPLEPVEQVEEPADVEPVDDPAGEPGEPIEESASEKAERLAREKFGAAPAAAEAVEEPVRTTEAQTAQVDLSKIDKDLSGFVAAALNGSPDAAKFKEFAEEYPEVGLMMGTVARSMLGALASGAAVSLPPAVQEQLSQLPKMQEANTKLQNIVERQTQILDDMIYFASLEELRPGARKTAKSGDFGEWLAKEASVGVRKLSEDPDPEAGAAVLDVYNESRARKAAAVVDKKKGVAGASAGLKTPTARSKARSAATGISKSDEDAGWDLPAPKRWQR